jgi:predicted alpha/beta superfamily hydrolase
MKYLLCTTLLMLTFTLSVQAAQVVQIVVHVPADTPATDTIYLSGSLPAAGAWKPDGLKLERQKNGTHTAPINLDPGQTLEFKVTRGAWTSVEKSADGTELPNRSITIDASTKLIDVKVQRWSTGAAAVKSTVVGTLKLHNIESKFLRQSRTIRVWLPPAYDAAADARYPVLYMHDGQNCFDRATSFAGNEWEIDETLTRLITDKTIPPLIVVGIDNGLANRLSEYTYVADQNRGGGRGADHADFLLKEIKPFIEKTYRAHANKRNTLIGGSSLGGLNSLEIARRNPDTFGGVLAMSPSLHWADSALLNALAQTPDSFKGTRIWLDIGTREGRDDQSNQHVERVRALQTILLKHNVRHHLEIEDGAEHTEPAWASRFGPAITYLMKSQ